MNLSFKCPFFPGVYIISFLLTDIAISSNSSQVFAYDSSSYFSFSFLPLQVSFKFSEAGKTMWLTSPAVIIIPNKIIHCCSHGLFFE